MKSRFGDYELSARCRRMMKAENGNTFWYLYVHIHNASCTVLPFGDAKLNLQNSFEDFNGILRDDEYINPYYY